MQTSGSPGRNHEKLDSHVQGPQGVAAGDSRRPAAAAAGSLQAADCLGEPCRMAEDQEAEAGIPRIPGGCTLDSLG